MHCSALFHFLFKGRRAEHRWVRRCSTVYPVCSLFTDTLSSTVFKKQTGVKWVKTKMIRSLQRFVQNHWSVPKLFTPNRCFPVLVKDGLHLFQVFFLALAICLFGKTLMRSADSAVSLKSRFQSSVSRKGVVYTGLWDASWSEGMQCLYEDKELIKNNRVEPVNLRCIWWEALHSGRALQ